MTILLGFFALLAIGALGLQLYGLTGRHERRTRLPRK